MKQIIILESFDGYPDGRKRSFVAGSVAELPDAYAELVVGKGLAREAAPETEPSVTKPARAKGEAKRASSHEDE